jgi:hypothetical protein
MLPEMKGWKFDTDCGLFVVEYLTDPTKAEDSNRWEYWLQLKWIDPQNAGNRATPEFRLHLELLEEAMLDDRSHERLADALRLWLDGMLMPGDHRLRFDADSGMLKERA